jgi:hypothetical protein
MSHQVVSAIDPASGVLTPGFLMYPPLPASGGLCRARHPRAAALSTRIIAWRQQINPEFSLIE